MPYNEFLKAFPNHNFLVDEVEDYRRSLLAKPIRTYFKAGQFSHTTPKGYTFDPDLETSDEFFMWKSLFKKEFRNFGCPLAPEHFLTFINT